MSWEIVRLGDVISTLKGFAFKSSHYTESGHPIVRASNFTMDSISDEDLKYYSCEEALQYEKYSLKKNDILIQTVGSWEYNPNSVVGKVVKVPEQLDGALLNQNIVKIIPNATVDNVFLYYRLKCSDFAKYNIGNAVGAANQASITLDTIRNFTFACPDIITQKQIANILSSYDNLVANNQKQIKLLEEAAQRLYKEWFVDLRFPGHETTSIIDGVPQGWSKRLIGDVIEKTYRSKQVMASDYLKEGIIPIIDQSRDFIAGYTNDEETLVCLNRPVIVFGDHTRVLKYIQFPFAKGADGTQLILSNYKNMPQPLLYLSLQNVDLSNYHYARHFKYLKAEEIIVPDIDVANAFEKIINPMFKKIQTMRDQIRNAQQARDRLLPKLMSGEIEV